MAELEHQLRLLENSDEQAAKNTIAHIRQAYHEVMVEGPESRKDDRENLAYFDGLMLCQMAEGHLFAEDEPGVGKTSGAKAYARLQDIIYNRIQMTPDTLPRAITGWSEPSGVKYGPIFANFVLVDEIRRAAPETQSALLEVMEEGQATFDGQTHPLHLPYMFVATTNPEEHEGTYPLPQAQLDRFSMSITLRASKDRRTRGAVARRNRNGGLKAEPIRVGGRTLNADVILSLQKVRRNVAVPTKLEDEYVPALVDYVSDHKQTRRQPTGYRAEIWIPRLAQARALMLGEAEVTVDHVDYVAFSALNHRFDTQYDNDGRPFPKTQVVREATTKARAETGL
jgi:MoxR-like ATPase